MTLGFVGVLMVGNLRGIRESGRIFAVPTYFFIVTTLAMIAVGVWHAATGTIQPVVTLEPLQSTHAPLALFLILTAFSNGCTAMTGVEAVSNGVPAFRPPESKNAATTMLVMAVLAITMFLGITLLAQSYHILPSEQETVISQLARGVFGRGFALLRGPGRDDADSRARGEHGVRGLSAAGVDPGARSVSPAATDEPGRPAGVLERHRRPERLCGDSARGVWRRHARADPACT